MQLPRGTFREIRKKVVLQDLLFELIETRFSGTCGIVAGPATGSFVFQNGACILARFHGKAGDSGIREMRQSARDEVEVIISTLDETQIKLALEFNPGCRVLKEGTPIPGRPAVPDAAPGQKSPSVHAAGPQASPHPARPGRRVLITGEIPIPKKPHEPDRVAPRVLAHPVPEKRETDKPVPKPAGKDEDFESDIDALDSMDLDLVTSRLRSDCKNLVRHLDLDHLIER